MKTSDPVIQAFIDFLETSLGKGRPSFTKVGPRTFFYRDDVDTILVKVTDENLVVITDGENVCDRMAMYLLDVDEESDYIHFDYYLQKILHFF